jgi:glycosyltransferase involved in cell wall biosynthesis
VLLEDDGQPITGCGRIGQRRHARLTYDDCIGLKDANIAGPQRFGNILDGFKYIEVNLPDQHKISVVIPAYRAESTIARAVNSVLCQSGVQTEIIVVIDGLLDRTEEILREYASRVKVIINRENRGSQVSRNLGLGESSGTYVMFLDCDDFLEGPMLRGLVESMLERDADICFGPMQVLLEASGKRRPVVYRSYTSTDDLFRLWMADAQTVAPCAIMWRSDFLRAIGGWNEKIRRNQDGEVVMRTILSGGRFAVSRMGRGVYVEHDSPHRITKRPENLPSSFEVGELLLAQNSPAISENAKREGLAGYFYRIALRFYRTNQLELAERSIDRAKALGLNGHRGPAWHRISATLLGLRLRYRISNCLKHLLKLCFK